MSEYVFAQDIGDILLLFSPFEDFPREVVFVKMAGKNIDRLLTLKNGFHDMSRVHPEIEYQDGLFRFECETAMEDVGQPHYLNSVGSILQMQSSLITFGAALPASISTFLPSR